MFRVTRQRPVSNPRCLQGPPDVPVWVPVSEQQIMIIIMRSDSLRVAARWFGCLHNDSVRTSCDGEEDEEGEEDVGG